jgi:predicted transporter
LWNSNDKQSIKYKERFIKFLLHYWCFKRIIDLTTVSQLFKSLSGGEDMTHWRVGVLLGVIAFILLGFTVQLGVLNAAEASSTSASSSVLLQVQPTPQADAIPQVAAPIGEGTRQALMIIGMVLVSVVLIGGGIYLRQRWIATRY